MLKLVAGRRNCSLISESARLWSMFCDRSQRKTRHRKAVHWVQLDSYFKNTNSWACLFTLWYPACRCLYNMRNTFPGTSSTLAFSSVTHYVHNHTWTVKLKVIKSFPRWSVYLIMFIKSKGYTLGLRVAFAPDAPFLLLCCRFIYTLMQVSFVLKLLKIRDGISDFSLGRSCFRGCSVLCIITE